jgi:hypothetical protein
MEMTKQQREFFELGRKSIGMTDEQVEKMLADRPDLLAVHRRMTAIDRAERLRAVVAKTSPVSK